MSDAASVPTESLRPLLEQWLPGQRWYAGKGRSASFTASRFAEIRPAGIESAQNSASADGSTAISIWIVRAEYDDGSAETYQVPLVLRPEPVASLEHVLVGTVSVDDQPRWVYDALHDKDATPALLQGIRDQQQVDGLSFERFVEPERIPVGEQSLVLTGEQSNTSLVFGKEAIFKAFRRLEAGINPDIEVHAALMRQDCKHIAALLGTLSGDLDGHPTSLGMLQEFLTTGTDGWELAKTSVRDLFAEADLRADECGGDFSGEAERLGAAVAAVHQDLAAAFGVDQMAGEELAARGAAMHHRLDVALDIVPQLREQEPALREIFDAFMADTSPLPVQRVHGDLHLGQVMRTVRRWVLLDFEGEPILGMSQRRAKDSALRDIAGMLRSFDYASRHQLIDTMSTSQLVYRADEWADRNRDAFCTGYAAAAGSDPRAQDVRLRAFEADKAVYEAIYEARNRPSWLSIPLSSLTRLGKPNSGAPTEGSA